MIVTRFAPSPTGRLHLGHAYAAKVAHDLARSQNGRFLLRFEDIDHTRVRAQFYDQIVTDLHWLGLTWDEEPWRQLDRLAAYEDALNKLKALGVVYPCYCTRKEINTELANFAHAPHGPEGALYPGTCRDLKVIPANREPAWRIDCQKAQNLVGKLSFHDERSGLVPVEAGLLGDVILARKDIGTSYHLAVTIDDAAQEITHVTRGEDLLPSTHLHRVLQTLLELPEPRYHHHPLICDDTTGERLAKRHNSLSINTLREKGNRPGEVLKMLNNR